MHDPSPARNNHEHHEANELPWLLEDTAQDESLHLHPYFGNPWAEGERDDGRDPLLEEEAHSAITAVKPVEDKKLLESDYEWDRAEDATWTGADIRVATERDNLPHPGNTDTRNPVRLRPTYDVAEQQSRNQNPASGSKKDPKFRLPHHAECTEEDFFELKPFTGTLDDLIGPSTSPTHTTRFMWGDDGTTMTWFWLFVICLFSTMITLPWLRYSRAVRRACDPIVQSSPLTISTRGSDSNTHPIQRETHEKDLKREGIVFSLTKEVSLSQGLSVSSILEQCLHSETAHTQLEYRRSLEQSDESGLISIEDTAMEKDTDLMGKKAEAHIINMTLKGHTEPELIVDSDTDLTVTNISDKPSKSVELTSIFESSTQSSQITMYHNAITLAKSLGLDVEDCKKEVFISFLRLNEAKLIHLATEARNDERLKIKTMLKEEENVKINDRHNETILALKRDKSLPERVDCSYAEFCSTLWNILFGTHFVTCNVIAFVVRSTVTKARQLESTTGSYALEPTQLILNVLDAMKVVLWTKVKGKICGSCTVTSNFQTSAIDTTSVRSFWILGTWLSFVLNQSLFSVLPEDLICFFKCGLCACGMFGIHWILERCHVPRTICNFLNTLVLVHLVGPLFLHCVVPIELFNIALVLTSWAVVLQRFAQIDRRSKGTRLDVTDDKQMRDLITLMRCSRNILYSVTCLWSVVAGIWDFEIRR